VTKSPELKFVFSTDQISNSPQLASPVFTTGTISN
jgi:hypothetical protein